MKNIPVLTVQGTTIAEAYEKALIELYRKGIPIPTQYDGPEDPPSIDATMNITIVEPWKDPMIHKAFPGGIDSLREYVLELEGRKDLWVKNMNDPNDTRWEYTYHQRLADWGTWYELEEGERKKISVVESLAPDGVNQVDEVVRKLIGDPNTRQAQMITWVPFLDIHAYDPPCLQSVWYRLVEDEGVYYLNCNIRFRSNDAWGANFMNMFGFVHFTQTHVADKLREGLEKPVKLGRLNWHADSYHLYGKDQEDFRKRFWERLDSTAFDERVFNFHEDFVQEIWEESHREILEKITRYEGLKRWDPGSAP